MVVKGCSLTAVIREANRVGSHKPPIAHFFMLTVESMLQLFTTDSFHQSWPSFAVIWLHLHKLRRFPSAILKW